MRPRVTRSHFFEWSVCTDVERETELALVEGLRGGDARAFDAVYDAYGARLFTFLARLSRRRDLAEDLAEETWLRLVAHAPKLRPDTRLGPWLFAVARNLYLERLPLTHGRGVVLGEPDRALAGGGVATVTVRRSVRW